MKFSLTNYAKLWSSIEGRNVMRAILNNPELIKPNFTFWRQDFGVDREITPTNARGLASFTSYMKERDNAFMMDMRAPLGDTIPVEHRGGRSYSGSIPDYSARGYVETAPERMQREKLMDQFADVRWLADFAQDELQRMLNQANQTLSYQAAMLLSTGNIVYKKGEGIQGAVIKADIPKENFMSCGKEVWTSPNCNLISQMIEIQDKIKDKLEVGMSFQWQITKEMWQNVFMKNKQVQEWARFVRLQNDGVVLPETYALLSETVKSALSKYEGLDPIVIVEEKQKDVVEGVVHGWANNTAVYRPVGLAGVIRRASILDKEVYEKYGNKVNSYNFTEAMDGLGVFMNSEIVNGNFSEWHTDFFMKAVPTLEEFLYHYIINTAHADE